MLIISRLFSVDEAFFSKLHTLLVCVCVCFFVCTFKERERVSARIHTHLSFHNFLVFLAL